jgi:putative intracellular protease/amidase
VCLCIFCGAKRIILCIKKKRNNWIKNELCDTYLSIYVSIRSGGKKALIFVANGSEDTEVVATVDVLRRGGIDVKLCSVEKNDKKPLTCANNIQIVPDLHIDDVQGQQFDAVIVPGGKYNSYKITKSLFFAFLGSKGTEKIASCKKAGVILLDHYKSNKLVAAICAGPMALSAHLYDADENARKHDITCYPDAAISLKNKFKSVKLDVPVVDSEVNQRHLITSQGPATAIEFGLKILSHLADETKADEIRKKMLA